MQRDLGATHSAVTSQLSQVSSGAWTSSGIVDDLTPQLMDAVSATFKDLDPLIRVRFLVACCLAPPDKKPALMPGLRNVIQLARQDEDEWVQALGHSIDPEHASIRLAAESVQHGRSEIEDTVKELVVALDAVTVNSHQQLCPTVDTFVCTSQAPAVNTPVQHAHFTVRENYQEIEAVLLEGRPGDACLPSIISRASHGSGYAALFSGQHTVTAAPQFRQNKVASASMFAKSTASHPKPHSAGQRHAGAASQGQYPNKRTKLTASLPAPPASKAHPPSAGVASSQELQGRTGSPAATRADAAGPSGNSGASAGAAAAPHANGAAPSRHQPAGTAGALGTAPAQAGATLPDAGSSPGKADTPAQAGVTAGGADGVSRAAAGVFRRPQAAAAEENGAAEAREPGDGNAAASVRPDAQPEAPEAGAALVQASVASSDLPAVHLERAGSSRHGDG